MIERFSGGVKTVKNSQNNSLIVIYFNFSPQSLLIINRTSDSTKNEQHVMAGHMANA